MAWNNQAESSEHLFAVWVIDHHFNVSSADFITIIVKTEAPYLSIRNPGGGDRVNGEFYIEGRIEDNDFSAFQLLISNYRAGKNAKMGR